MNRTLSNLAPALLLAGAILAATALVVAAPHASWAAVAGPLLLVLALVGADVVHGRRSGRRALLSASALVLAVTLPVACGLVASRSVDQLAGAIPILGSCAALPILLRHKGAHGSTCSLV